MLVIELKGLPVLEPSAPAGPLPEQAEVNRAPRVTAIRSRVMEVSGKEPGARHPTGVSRRRQVDLSSSRGGGPRWLHLQVRPVHQAM